MCVRTRQGEHPCLHEEQVKKGPIVAITIQKLLKDTTPWQPPEELLVGGGYRINTNQLNSLDEHIRTQADAELLKLQQLHIRNREDEHYHQKL